MKKLYYISLMLLTFLLACQQPKPCTQNVHPNNANKTVLKAWHKATEQNTIASYQEFIKNFACNDSLIRLAQKKIDSLQEEQDWLKVQKYNNIDSLRAFCRRHPYSIHHTEAKKLAALILHQQLDTKYKTITEFLEQMTKSTAPYQTFKNTLILTFALSKSDNMKNHSPYATLSQYEPNRTSTHY